LLYIIYNVLFVTNLYIMKNSKLLLALVAGFGINMAFAQDVATKAHTVAVSLPEIAILDIETTTTENISFALDATGLEAGSEFVIDEQNSDLWINYTSLVPAAATQRSITIEAANLPTIAGLTITVEAAAHSGIGGGNLGTPTAVVTPSAVPTDIITGIGSAFTGNGNAKGHNLTYYLDFAGDFGDLNVADGLSSNISMTYTITD